MFDTVRAAYNEVELNTARLMKAGFRKVVTTFEDGEGGEKESLSYRWMASATDKAKFESPHFVQYIPSVGVVKFETSLPKVLYRENVSMLKADDLPRVLDEISNRVQDLCGDLPHAKESHLRGRLDAVYNWRVQEGDKSYVSDYLHALRSAQASRHKSDSYASETVDADATLYWFNRQRRIRAYDKFRESGLDSARGILRFEAQMNHAKAELMQVGHLGQDTLADALNWENARRVLAKYLAAVGGDLVITDDVTLLKKLLKVYKPVKAVRLYAYTQLSDSFTDRELADLGVSRISVWRNMRDVKKAGLARGSGKHVKKNQLPQLRLPENYNGEPLNVFGGE